ncbi:50S ribosomal protein L11 methyltransferase [uncultured Aquabacterium sp.]|uniref:50S ribosomal protein L11 methyltransferase n=1 Tax=uncultured Aquabacterium sp. TaxID=158753 RepID=UPI0030CB9CA0|tara:strand:- start:442 stop:1485 length:1044 start_codon:yes stop_codon:yes gene_type:complete
MTAMHSYALEQVWSPLSESLIDWDEDFHQLMLNDRLRMVAYRKAIFETVQPGDRVVDLGTGTGILSLWALEAGAAEVIGIDLSAPILAMAVERMKQAGFTDRFKAVHAFSHEVELSEPVDVLMSEIIGNMGDNENFQPILQDGIKRFLKPQGKLLPQNTHSYLVPVCAPRAHADVREGRVDSLTQHYDVQQLYRDRQVSSPFNLYYDCIVPCSAYLSQPQVAAAYFGDWTQPAHYSRSLSFTLNSQAMLTGFKVYFVAQLSDDTQLDISGDDIGMGKTSDSWKHAYLPIATPIEVQLGDRLHMTWSRSAVNRLGSFAQAYRWRGAISRLGLDIGYFDQCMDEALLRN